MSQFRALLRRNSKLFFKDKGMFFTALITPMILLVLYATFLGNIYRDTFASALPAMLPISDRLLDGCVGGQLISSILAVSCVSVAFCANMLMVQDKANGTIHDLTIAPVKQSALAMSYYFATLVVTLIICYAATALCLVYVAAVGWYMSLADVLLILLDVFVLVMFGTVLSSIINIFLSTQGQISAVGTIISSCYGFICGAYMPISSFGAGLRKAVSFLPGTYGTSLLRQHALRGVLQEMEQLGAPAEAVRGMADAMDCNVYFSGDAVAEPVKYAILGGATVVLIGVFLLIHALRSRKAR